MSKATNQTVVLVGGPDAGKTNYLGRLWLALDSETCAIAKNGLPSQVEYLRTIASSLNAGEFSQRTPPAVFESTSIPVTWDKGRSFGELVVPDCAGEQWEKIHKERVWGAQWERAVTSMAGCILFFRGSSTHNVEPLNWSNNAEVMTCLQGAADWDAGTPKLPTQVVLVDWLQCLSAAYRDIQGSEQPLRVSIVLAAWDMAPKEARENSPDEYLGTQLPLLHDFLLGNPSLFLPKTFGVSIAGGVLTSDDTPFMRKFLTQDPNRAGYVMLARGKKLLKSADLTLPLAWAFGCTCPEFSQSEVAKP